MSKGTIFPREKCPGGGGGGGGTQNRGGHYLL